MTPNRIVEGENLEVLRTLGDAQFELVYIDPPFNTGQRRRHTRTKVQRDEAGTRTGFGDRRYNVTELGTMSYADIFDDFVAFLEPRLREAHRVLTATGSLFLHIDPREAHYCKILLDVIFGRDAFMNEIVWAYDYGGRSKRRWPAKHDTIFWYAKNPGDYVFDYDAIDRIPYMAPNLVGAAKAERGKTPTDVWWQTIVPTSSHERTGYPTQKPLKLLERIVRVHSRPGAWLLDFFAGSGTFGEAAARHDRRFVLVDHNPEAIAVMRERLAFAEPEIVRHASSPSDLR